MRPVSAPKGTMSFISVSLSARKVASRDGANHTRRTRVKPVPVSVTVLPRVPRAGVKPVMTGIESTVKGVLEVTAPALVTTRRGPVLAPDGTNALSRPSLVRDMDVAGTPLNSTRLTPVKNDPSRVTWVPASPLVGEKRVRGGTVPPSTVKLPGGVRDCPATETFSCPDAAPAGTMAVSCVALTTVVFAYSLPNRTDVDPAKPLPVSDTTVPTAPLAGLNPVSVGAAMTVKGGEPTCPFVFTTRMEPLVAPLGTST